VVIINVISDIRQVTKDFYTAR